jgi:hypothetical protein
VAYIFKEQEAICQVRDAEPTTTMTARRNMKYILDFFALVGLVSTIIVAGFYLGYTTYQPKCHTAMAIFTKDCK